ncbi:MAG: Dabb family protein [Myxococcota bacterium]
MIERLVLLKLVDGGYREEIAEAARRDLPRIPGVRRVRVGTPADADSAVWDLLLAIEFDRIEDVGLYLNHPIHRTFFDQVLSPRVEVRKAWNFVMD